MIQLDFTPRIMSTTIAMWVFVQAFEMPEFRDHLLPWVIMPRNVNKTGHSTNWRALPTTLMHFALLTKDISDITYSWHPWANRLCPIMDESRWTSRIYHSSSFNLVHWTHNQSLIQMKSSSKQFSYVFLTTHRKTFHSWFSVLVHA